MDLKNEVLLRILNAVEEDNYSIFIKKTITDLGFPNTGLGKRLDELVMEGAISNETVNGKAFKYKINKKLECPSYLTNNELSLIDKAFILEYDSLFGGVQVPITKVASSMGKSYESMKKKMQALKNKYAQVYDIIKTSSSNIAIKGYSTLEHYSIKPSERIYNKKSIAHHLLLQSKRSQKMRNRYIEYSLTEEIIQAQLDKQENKCYYSGLELTEDNTPSVDRLDSEEGYIESNIVICLAKVNIMKSDLSEIEFKNLIELIYKNYII